MTSNSCTFNIESGDTEAFLRAQCDKFLSQAEYGALAQLQSTQEILTALQGTYLARYIADIRPTTLSLLRMRLTRQLSDELDQLEAEAEEPFYQMIQFVRARYMIDNVVLALLAFLQRSSDGIQFHAIGYQPLLDQMASSQDTFTFLLEQLPIAKYFSAQCVETINSLSSLSEQDFLAQLELIRCQAFRAFFVDFYGFIKRAGGATYEATRELLEFECDARAILLKIDLMNQQISPDDMQKLFVPIGKLYPNGHVQLAQASDMDGIRQAVNDYAEYVQILDAVQGKGINQSILDAKVGYLIDCLSQQFNLGCVWAWVQLREIENENVVWISECVEQKRSSGDLKNVVLIKR